MVNKVSEEAGASSSAAGQGWQKHTLLELAGLLGRLKRTEKMEFKRYKEVARQFPPEGRIKRLESE